MNLTRRQSLTGIAGILAAGVAPAAVVRSMIGARGVVLGATGGGGGILGYTTDGLVAMWDAIDNEGTGTHNPNATKWADVSGNGYDLNTLVANGWVDGDSRDASKSAYGIAKELTDADVQTVSFCCEQVSIITNARLFIGFGNLIKKKVYLWNDRIICNASTSYGPEIDIHNVNSMTIQFLNGTMSGRPFNPSWYGDDPCNSYKSEYSYSTPTFVISDNYFAGKIHNVRIYNKFLTQEEITANWNNDKSRFNLT